MSFEGVHTVAYIDVESNLLTSTGANFGKEFESLLASFRFSAFDALHHQVRQQGKTPMGSVVILGQR